MERRTTSRDDNDSKCKASDDIASSNLNIIIQNKDHNRYLWRDYTVPVVRRRLLLSLGAAAADVEAEVEVEVEADGSSTVVDGDMSFTLRHLKQGATGAVTTWPVAAVLLEYLVRRGGWSSPSPSTLRGRPDGGEGGEGDAESEDGDDYEDDDDDDDDDDDALDFTTRPGTERQFREALSPSGPSAATSSSCRCYNVLELGAGTGYLGIGLAISMNGTDDNDGPADSSGAGHRDILRCHDGPRVRVLCTDKDRLTLKNMRYNISNQPRHTAVSKTVRVEALDWGDNDVGGPKFLRAVQSMFQPKTTAARRRRAALSTKDATLRAAPPPSGGSVNIAEDNDDDDDDDGGGGGDNDDPIRLLTHVIASDVHYGETTLEPLSSVIAAIKLRNRNVRVILLLKERSPDAVSNLKRMIEAKVTNGEGRVAKGRDGVDHCGSLPRLDESSITAVSSAMDSGYDHHRGHPKYDNIAETTRASSPLARNLKDDAPPTSFSRKPARHGRFRVRVRTVRHDDITNMKMVEC